MPTFTRRALFAGSAAALCAQSFDPGIDSGLISQHDQSIDTYFRLQVTDPASPWHGMFPDAYGLHTPGTVAGSLDLYGAAYCQPKSKHFKSRTLAQRILLSAETLRRKQLPSGNFNLLITNFDSTPDTGFITRSMCHGARHLRRAGAADLYAPIAKVLKRNGEALIEGGVHTPNHRWVCSAAMAQLHELEPDPRLIRRIDQWLAEGIDLDIDGQFSERSTLTYNGVSTDAFTILAIKLNRNHLLDPVRRNLDALTYLLHPGDEVVTEISRRQDANTRGKAQGSWFPLAWLARADNNPVYASIAAGLSPSMSRQMEFPELTRPVPTGKIPDDYERLFPSGEYAHIRRGRKSSILLLRGNSRFLGVRSGGAVINAVRVASAFFGKGQFVPQTGFKRQTEYLLTQDLESGYWQPLPKPYPFSPTDDAWYATRKDRQNTAVQHLRYHATIVETSKGIRLRLQAAGTDEVPLAIEINCGDGAKLDGVKPAPGVARAWLLPEGGFATIRSGPDTLRVGPGIERSAYTQIRGAQPKLPGDSIYLTGYTPFDHTLEFEL